MASKRLGRASRERRNGHVEHLRSGLSNALLEARNAQIEAATQTGFHADLAAHGKPEFSAVRAARDTFGQTTMDLSAASTSCRANMDLAESIPRVAVAMGLPLPQMGTKMRFCTSHRSN